MYATANLDHEAGKDALILIQARHYTRTWSYNILPSQLARDDLALTEFSVEQSVIMHTESHCPTQYAEVFAH